MAVHPCFVKPMPDSAVWLPMREDQPSLPRRATSQASREARLAAKLRENLQRRKRQAREIGRESDADPSQAAE